MDLSKLDQDYQNFESQLREVLSELNSKTSWNASVDVDKVREICREILSLEDSPGIPWDLRECIYQVLLGCFNKEATQLEEWMDIHRVPDDSNEDPFAFRNPYLSPDAQSGHCDHVLLAAKKSDWIKTLRADMPRTRTDTKIFTNNPKVQADCELLLTFYCVSRGVSYKQGLNEILSPFLVLREMLNEKQRINAPWGPLYMSFYSLISKFLPSIYDDDEFESLQTIFRLFQHLLQFHDPHLCNFLDQNYLMPELYAIPWFITLFARALPIDLVFALWDQYIVYDDPFLHYLMALALIIENRELLFISDRSSLPAALSQVHKSYAA